MGGIERALSVLANYFIRQGYSVTYISCLPGHHFYRLNNEIHFIEPGFNVGVARKNAFINGEAIFVESANHENILAKVSIENSPGRDAFGYDFDTGLRIQEAYAKAGKELVYFVWKNYLQ